MSYASVVLDIPTRALATAYDYAVPPALADDVRVGSTVLVTFSHRPAVGYVMGLSDTPPEGVAPEKVRPVEQVLAAPAFDEVGARVALWMAREYACPLPEAVRPFLAPGQKTRVTRADEGANWELVREKAGPVDARWVALAPAAAEFVPKKNAPRQREVLEAIAQAPQKLSDLCALVPGAGSVVTALAKKGVVVVESRRQLRGGEATTLSSAAAPRPKALTKGQEQALEAIASACERGRGDVVLVDGVTGSGKTEVYLAAIERVLAEGRGAIVLVPEISLTAQTVGRFRSRFGDDVAIIHSRLSVGERYDQWDLVRMGEAHVVVGARSALFAPMANVGLIIIDEEHEGSYKQDSAPRYHAREVAARLAKERGAALVLGSATPSLESIARCRRGSHAGVSWTRVEMPERPGGSTLPTVTVVDMGAEFRGGGQGIFSTQLVEALRDVATRREKAVLLLNRRGFASFLMCKECGCVPECPHCSTALTYHERTHSLVCHTCDRSWPVRAWPDPSTRCPNCGSRYLQAFGMGTQRVEDELAMILPDDVAIIRMDADTTRGKDAHQKLLEQFDAAECAVLVGTQMIAKGLDFPQVTLVGVINADTMLKLPDFRAAERTYALLEQVSGRAGRGERPGRVIIQSWWASHPAIQAAARHERPIFVEPELAERQDASYPPFSRVANVRFWGRASGVVGKASGDFARILRGHVEGRPGWEVLGPADCVRSKLKDNYYRHVMVKAPLDAEVGPVLSASAAELGRVQGVSVAIDVDAHDMM